MLYFCSYFAVLLSLFRVGCRITSVSAFASVERWISLSSSCTKLKNQLLCLPTNLSLFELPAMVLFVLAARRRRSSRSWRPDNGRRYCVATIALLDLLFLNPPRVSEFGHLTDHKSQFHEALLRRSHLTLKIGGLAREFISRSLTEYLICTCLVLMIAVHDRCLLRFSSWPCHHPGFAAWRSFHGQECGKLGACVGEGETAFITTFVNLRFSLVSN